MTYFWLSCTDITKIILLLLLLLLLSSNSYYLFSASKKIYLIVVKHVSRDVLRHEHGRRHLARRCRRGWQVRLLRQHVRKNVWTQSWNIFVTLTSFSHQTMYMSACLFVLQLYTRKLSTSKITVWFEVQFWTCTCIFKTKALGTFHESIILTTKSVYPKLLNLIFFDILTRLVHLVVGG